MEFNSWQKVELGDICLKIGSGATPRGGQKVYLDTGEYKLIRSQNVYNEGFSAEGLVFLTEHHAKELSNVELELGDVLLNITGDSVARCCQVNESHLPGRVNQHVCIIRPDPKKLNPQFLRYWLISPQMQALMLSWADSGGTRKALTKGMIESFEIPCPPLDEQKAIAHILGTLDDKIELNQQMNRTLEAIARALFKSWFIDFDPVRAKLDGRQPAGMDAETAALFPAEFEDGGAIGKIPKGWKVKPIGEAVKTIGGATPSTSEPAYWEGGTIPWSTPKDLASLSSPVLLDTDRCITEQGLQKISSGLLPKGTLLLSSRAPIGYLAIAEVPLAINQGYIAMICDQELSNHYVLRWAQTNMDIIEGRANGTTFMEISKKNFRPIPVLVPEQQILKIFNKQAELVHQQVVNNLRQNKNLTSIRDVLLPKLLSGEIRVKEAEKIVAEVA